MADLKNIIYISNEDFETLISTGTVTINGETLTYDPDNVYITPDQVATTTTDGLMSASDKTKLDGIGNYLASASVSGNTLTLTPNSGSATTFTPTFTEQHTGDVTGSSLTANKIVLGNGGVAIKASTYEPSPSSNTWSDSSDVLLPTMKSVKNYVEGKNYGQGTITGVSLNGTSVTTSGVADLTGVVTSVNNIAPSSGNVSLTAANVGALANYSIGLSTGGPGVMQAKFLTINYNNTTSENAVLLYIGMVSSHGNATSYKFYQDVIISCDTGGNVGLNIYKYFGASAGTVDSASRLYGDIYYVKDTTNKIIDFYVLLGQWSQVNSTPYLRLGKPAGGTITQYSGSATLYSSGDKTYGSGGIYALTSDLASYVPTSRTVNSKTLSSDITLNYSDIAAGNIAMGDGTNYFTYRTASGLEAGYYFHTYSDESVVFANQYANTGWMFVNGAKPSDRTNWSSLSPTLHIKNGGVAINKLIGIGVTPTYKLDVNGSANATTLYQNGVQVATTSQIPGSTKGITYIDGDTNPPSAANTDGGLIIVVMSSEPATKYDGYIYLITE